MPGAVAAAVVVHHNNEEEAPMVDDNDRQSEFFSSGLQTKVDPIQAFLSSEPPPEDAARHKLAVVMHSELFESALGTLLLGNAVLLGLELDHGETPAIQALSWTMLVVFLVEIVLRVYALRSLFWSVSNTFDFVIVIAGFIAQIIDASQFDIGSGKLVLKLIRLARLGRLFTTFRSLNLILQSFIHAITGVIWVLAMMLICVYIFALIARAFIGLDTDIQYASLSSGVKVSDLFGSVPYSSITMMQMITLDSCTSQVARPIAELTSSYPHLGWTYVFFLLYTLLGAFGILNLLTAVFVNALLEATEKRKKDLATEQRATKLANISQIHEMFAAVDDDKSGTLQQSEMDDVMQEFADPKWKDIFEQLEMTPATFGKFLVYFVSATEEENGVSSAGVSYMQFLEYFANMDEQVLKSEQWKQQAEIQELRVESDQQNATLQEVHVMLKAICDAVGANVTFDTVDEGDVPMSRVPMKGTGNETKETSPSTEASVGVDQAPVWPWTDAPDEFEHKAQELFQRYDVDDSGTINNTHELEQLMTNMQFSFRLNTDISAQQATKLAEIDQGVAMEFTSFVEWYKGIHENYVSL